jgi:hypothetical protein
VKLEVQTYLAIEAQLESKAPIEQAICIYGKNSHALVLQGHVDYIKNVAIKGV